MWLGVDNCTTVAWGIAATFATIFALIWTLRLFKASTSVSSEKQQATEHPRRRVSLREHLEKNYTKKNLAEIARCAVMMEKLGQVETGVTLNTSTPLGGEEPDIFDLLAEDITIENDEEAEENDDDISPQARADIEAELLDSSMLSAENSSGDDEPIVEHHPDPQAGELETPQIVITHETPEAELAPEENDAEEEEAVLHEDDVINTQALKLSDSAMCTALSEMGVESMIQNLDNEENEVVAAKGEDSIEGGEDGSGDAAMCKYHDLVASLFVSKAIFLAKKEHRDEQRLTSICDTCQPTSVQSYKKVVDSLSDNEIQDERRAQESQLSQILELMQQHPDLFGDMSKQEMSEQAALYCA